MKGNTIKEFINDLLTVGGPEKEFIFRSKYYFLETILNEQSGLLELCMEEYYIISKKEKAFIKKYCYKGNTLQECVEQFEQDKLFDGLTIYEAESEIEVLFG